MIKLKDLLTEQKTDAGFAYKEKNNKAVIAAKPISLKVVEFGSCPCCP